MVLGSPGRDLGWKRRAHWTSRVGATTLLLGVYLVLGTACGGSEYDSDDGTGVRTDAIFAATTAASPLPEGVVPAFPGAEGGGALSKGGRGGRVYKVTNLNDSGPGSLRACVEASGPRTCVFTTGGRINLSSGLRVTSPYLTIAGQTAQGGGIEVVGTMRGAYLLRIHTNDVVIRYLRLFNDAHPGCDSSSQGCGVVAINNGARNVVLDHVTTAFTQDENISVWCSAAPCPQNVTVSWSVNAWPLADHPTGTVIGAGSASLDQTLYDIDWHHNYYVDVSHRAPLGSGKRQRWAYNAVLDWENYAARYSNGATSVDFVGNIYRCGNQTSCSTKWPLTLAPEWFWLAGTPSIFFHNNVWKNVDGSTRAAGDLPDAASWDGWARTVANSSVAADSATPAPDHWRSGSPLTAAGLPIAASGGVPYAGYVVAADGSNLETKLFDWTATGDAERGTAYGPVGAARRLDCAGNWIDNRDGLLTRAILQYVGGGDPAFAPVGGSPVRITTQTNLCWAPGQCGIPSLAAGSACADSDSDGMPDVYEDANGLNRLSAVDGPVVQPDGYTNLEHYLNGNAGTPPPPPPVVAVSPPPPSAPACGNRLTNTEAFGSAGWILSGATINANAAIGPTGTRTADKLVERASYSEHRVQYATTAASGTHTFSVYAKSAGRTSIELRAADRRCGAYFSLTNGAFLGGNVIAPSCVTAGSGWWRCAVTCNVPTNTTVYINVTRGLTGYGLYSGDGTSGVYLWGAQLNAGSSAAAYCSR